MNKIIRLAILSAPLLSLTACGEGWEAQKTDAAFPYGNQRTAGTGVAYVRAKMLPEKELKVESPAKVEVTKPAPEPTLDAEEIFTEQQIKGAPPPPIPAKPIEEEVEIEEHSSVNIDINMEGANISAEEYIAQEPKKIEGEIEGMQIENPQIDIAEIEPLSGEAADFDVGELENEFDMAFEFEGDDIIEFSESTTSQPITQIISPKQDFFDFRNNGEISLEEIYEDAFMSSF